jgi:hypothetical protein
MASAIDIDKEDLPQPRASAKFSKAVLTFEEFPASHLEV